MSEGFIYLRVPAGLKARWVRESRSAGMRLTDWIIKKVEASMPVQSVAISIPADLPFSALRLGRDKDGMVSFDTAIIGVIEQASGLPEGFFMARCEDEIASVIVAWYQRHLAAGGDRDPVADDLIAEAVAEGNQGHGFSHQPGSA